jgi:hypothetical protein
MCTHRHVVGHDVGLNTGAPAPPTTEIFLLQFPLALRELQRSQLFPRRRQTRPAEPGENGGGSGGGRGSVGGGGGDGGCGGGGGGGVGDCGGGGGDVATAMLQVCMPC